MNLVRDEHARLEALLMQLQEEDPNDEGEQMDDIIASIDMLDSETVEARAGELLHGLGFSLEMMHKKTRDMSGGWRMRVSLAQVRRVMVMSMSTSFMF